MHVCLPISLIFNATSLSSCLLRSCLSISLYSPESLGPSPFYPLFRCPSLPSSAPLSMADTAATTVCSMCGDVGFPEKLFRCARCRHRFQHSYCTNYYGDGAPASAGSDMCDWCLSDVVGIGNKARWSSSPAAGKQHAAGSHESSSTTSSGGSGGGRAARPAAATRPRPPGGGRPPGRPAAGTSCSRTSCVSSTT
ncbi:hypothetical protein BS78_06G181500 [Paspalum vaginatum]|nr:hypothetical protein BS78_06G181500 [Paspalum vaginatum]